jgi:hypothetical protein
MPGSGRPKRGWRRPKVAARGGVSLPLPELVFGQSVMRATRLGDGPCSIRVGETYAITAPFGRCRGLTAHEAPLSFLPLVFSPEGTQ